MNLTKSTPSIKKAEITRDWILIDATNCVVGRLASFIAQRLRGKHKTTFTANMDCGDNVIIINAEKIYFTGNKLEDKIYYRHTGYAGGLKQTTAKKVLDSKYPERIMEKAVERMITRNPLGKAQMKKLHIYAGSSHKHEAQTPIVIDFASMNAKNVKRVK